VRRVPDSDRSQLDNQREPITPPARPTSTLLSLAAAAIVGLVIGLQALSQPFITGTGGKWIRPENDYNAYLVAWNYFVVDAWRFPVFSLPQMGYPEGGSVLFNDALPLASLPTKLVYQVTGLKVNPFGWWMLLLYALQGAMAARVLQAAGVRTLLSGIVAAVLAVVSTAFLTRMGHSALASHFLILWALALHFSAVRERQVKAGQATVLLAVTLMINVYLFAIVFALVAATWGALLFRGVVTRRDLLGAGVGLVAVFAIGLVAGYGLVFANPSTMKSEGFGKYSWNLVTLLLPPDGVFGYFTDVPRDATHGQYEGEAYIGRGALLLLALALVSSPIRAAGLVRRYWVLSLTLLGLAAYAASNVVYFGPTLLASFELPPFALSLGNYFRATGRFIWPLSYALTLLPLACLLRWWRPMPAVLVALLAAYLQLTEALPGIHYRRGQTLQAYADLIDDTKMQGWITQHRRVWQFPSWDCGGLVGANRRWPSDDSNRELQLQLAAARVGVPMNSIYMSRALKDCRREATWADDPRLEADVLYVLGRPAVDASASLGAIARSNACVTLDWAVVCSASWD